MPGIVIRLSAAIAIANVAWLWGCAGTGGAVAPVAVAEASEQRSWRESDLWLAPDPEPSGPSDLARGIERLAAAEPADALPLLSTSLTDPVLGPYARLYVGRAHLALEDYARAATAARQVIEMSSGRPVGEAALWLLAESREGARQWTDAVAAWQTLADRTSAAPATVHLRLAEAAERAGSPTLARQAYARIYYEWPASPEAETAAPALVRIPAPVPAPTFQLELSRAEALYAAQRFADARTAFEPLRGRASGETRAQIELRLAQCDVQTQRFARGLDGLTAYLARYQGTGRIDAEYFRLAALRGLSRADYPARVERFVHDHPTSPLAESALNELATHYILANDDARAAGVFTDMYARFPRGAYADRAAWRAGWWAYRSGNYREAVRFFESAAMSLRRADYRSAWVYWTARAYAAQRQHATARIWFLRTIADYRNSYYGREALRALETLPGGQWTPEDVVAERDPARTIVAGTEPANAGVVRRLLEAGLWDDAIAELRYEQSESGTTPVIEATIAYALNRKGELRPGITAMRRAYPQFMSDGGEHLPNRMLKVIFPVAHWDVIRRFAEERRLDLYLVTALVAQESTFQADARSSADAWGLMQLLPSTGRRAADRIGLRGFTAAQLTDPETNVRLGTAYLSDLLAQFGDVAHALAAYNAGENRVVRWLAERPGLPRDEFTDAIPFPETQNYVKRIIGTAEDYRLLYGPSAEAVGARPVR